MLKPKLDDVTVEVTNKCHLRCRWCDIWREGRLYEVSLPSLTTALECLLAAFRINGISITGGEPFLHPDIAGILKTLAALKARRRIRSFGIYSNGACPDIIDKVLKKDAPLLAGMGIGISVDGLETTHDALRGRGAYLQTMKTLRRLSGRYGGMFDVELKFTANGVNCRELYDVYGLARAHGFRFTPKVAERDVPAYYHRAAPGGRSRPMAHDEHFFPVLRAQILQVLQQEARMVVKAVQPGMLKLLLRLAEKGTGGIKTCATPRRCLFITSRGDVHPCLYMPPAGSIFEKGFCSRAFFAARAACIRKGSAAACPGCFAYHGFLKAFNADHLA